MATVSGVWVFNETLNFSSILIGDLGAYNVPVNFTSKGETYTKIGIRQNMGPSQKSMYYETVTEAVMVYTYSTNAFTDDGYRTIDFGSNPQTVTDRFYTFLTANAIQQAAPSVPTPDWANCFVKTSAGNKAVEKVWIKQGSNLNLVWEAPAVTHKLYASEDMANNGGTLSLFINSKSYKLEDNSTDYVEIKTGDVIEGSAFISHNEFMALALKGVDTGTIYAQGDGGTDGAYLNVSYTVPSTLTEDLIFVEVMA